VAGASLHQWPVSPANAVEFPRNERGPIVFRRQAARASRPPSRALAWQPRSPRPGAFSCRSRPVQDFYKNCPQVAHCRQITLPHDTVQLHWRLSRIEPAATIGKALVLPPSTRAFLMRILEGPSQSVTQRSVGWVMQVPHTIPCWVTCCSKPAFHPPVSHPCLGTGAFLCNVT